MAELVLGLWADVANITFELADDPDKGQIRFYNSTSFRREARAAYPGDPRRRRSYSIRSIRTMPIRRSGGGAC